MYNKLRMLLLLLMSVFFVCFLAYFILISNKKNKNNNNKNKNKNKNKKNESFTNPIKTKHENKNNNPAYQRKLLYDTFLLKGKTRYKRTTEKIYDKFYTHVYNQIVHKQLFDSRVRFEVKQLIKKTNLRNYDGHGVLVDLGCGVGSHLKILSTKNLNIRLVGVDQSEEMLKQARENVFKNGLDPVRWINDNFINRELFARSSITHLTLYYFTIYYIDNLDKALECWTYWLKPNGYLVIHAVDPKRFDPVLDAASPFPGHSVQAFSKKRRTESTIHFSNFLYKSFFDYNPEDNTAKFEEHFEFDKHPNKRVNIHKLKMISADNIVQKCKKRGLHIQESVHLIKPGYAYEYILYFKKV